LSLDWHTLAPLLRSWGQYTSDHHKKKPIAYGALGVRDYYGVEASHSSSANSEAEAFKAIRKDFHLDP
jgi:hypothetical protein